MHRHKKDTPQKMFERLLESVSKLIGESFLYKASPEILEARNNKVYKDKKIWFNQRNKINLQKLTLKKYRSMN